jgi:methionine synthase II (cobalamin-independent)
MLEGWKKDKDNIYSTDELLQKYINVYNQAVAKIPSDMHVGIHLCRGNFVNSRHFSEGKHGPVGVFRR